MLYHTVVNLFPTWTIFLKNTISSDISIISFCTVASIDALNTNCCLIFRMKASLVNATALINCIWAAFERIWCTENCWHSTCGFEIMSDEVLQFKSHVNFTHWSKSALRDRLIIPRSSFFITFAVKLRKLL